VALERPCRLNPCEQDHLRACGRCRNHLARILHAVACADTEEDALFGPEPEAAALVTAEAEPAAEEAAPFPVAAARARPYEVLAALGSRDTSADRAPGSAAAEG
jgi:hypothetical protein